MYWNPRSWKRLVRRWIAGRQFGDHVLATRFCDDPVVIYIKDWSLFRDGQSNGKIALNPLVWRNAHRDITWLVPLSWFVSSNMHAIRFRRARKAILAAAPRHRVIFVANTSEECAILKEAGLETLLGNHNLFSDRNLFKPLGDLADRPFDAIYNARFMPYKRHDLAEAVPRLSLLGYSFETPEFARIRAKFTNAHFANEIDGDFHKLSFVEVNQALNQARVGLCLSEVEGAMGASAEYLLAGLPVVTTPSEGGRDMFFDDRFVRVAAPDPKAVASAVQSLADEKISPAFIREETLKKIDAASEKFLDDLSPMVGVSRKDISQLFAERFCHQLVMDMPRGDLFDS